MKTSLFENFEMDRYGLHCRFVKEDDAIFINQLRSNSAFAGKIHISEDNVNIQREWIKEYKNRERRGEEYYLLFESNKQPIGVYRIYNINWSRLTYTGGSWICIPGCSFEDVSKTILISDEFAFDILGLKMNLYEVQKINKKVLRFHREIIVAEEYGENDNEVLFFVTENIRKRNQIKVLLNL